MRIVRPGESFFKAKLLDCKVYVRKDLTVVKASEWYYVLVGDNSYYPISSLIMPEDGEVLLECAKELTETVELITNIMDSKGGYRNIYLRMENTEQTEDGKQLYLITMFDILDVESRTREAEIFLGKYRRFMTINSDWNNEYYFEYKAKENHFEIYKYMNEKAMQLYSSTLDEFVAKMEEENKPTPEQKEQMQTFCDYLRSERVSFEMEFTMKDQENYSTCRVRGESLYKNKEIVVGIMIPNQLAEKEAYYLTPAAKDAGTGLFNKKAIMEYTMERLHLGDGKTRWFVLFDIDDFKDINDTFGHLFGDQVIRKVADVLALNVGYRGVAGRFGGDEFFVLLEKIPDRESLKMLLKTIAKELAYAFDPQLKIKASIGVSQYPVDGSSYEKLFEKADKALYIAKEKGKDRHIIYDEKMHGSVQKDEMKTMKVSYMVSKEKRKIALVDIMSNICEKGVSYITEDPKMQKLLRDLYDLDGITIYADYGKKVICRSGDYNYTVEEIPLAFKDEKLLDLFGEEDVLAEPNMLKLKGVHAEAYIEYVKQEIGAFIQCIARKDGVPCAMISFEVFNRNRKWSDAEIEMLGLIGSCIGNLLCKEA